MEKRPIYGPWRRKDSSEKTCICAKRNLLTFERPIYMPVYVLRKVTNIWAVTRNEWETHTCAKKNKIWEDLHVCLYIYWEIAWVNHVENSAMNWVITIILFQWSSRVFATQERKRERKKLPRTRRTHSPASFWDAHCQFSKLHSRERFYIWTVTQKGLGDSYLRHKHASGGVVKRPHMCKRNLHIRRKTLKDWHICTQKKKSRAASVSGYYPGGSWKTSCCGWFVFWYMNAINHSKVCQSKGSQW